MKKDYVNILKINKYTQLTINQKIETWIDKTGLEGFEVYIYPDEKKNKLISFWIKDSERILNEPMSESHQKVYNNIMEIEQPKTDNGNNTESNITTVKTDNGVVILLPDTLTSELLSKWSKIPVRERILKFQHTPPLQVKKRKVGKDTNNKDVFVSYVTGNYMIKEANICFNFDWQFVKEGYSIGEKGVCVWGTLKAKGDNGEIISRCGEGYEELNLKMTPQLALKSATTDAIKKALSRLGFNNDVYSGDCD